MDGKRVADGGRSPSAPYDRAWVFWLVSAVAVVFAVVAAWRVAWICDDAFISFRYADNLAEGLGLVFNPGERVEGYTNLLWTLWLAVASAASLDLERWSIGWSLGCHAVVIAILCWRVRPASGRGLAIPVAAVLAAVHGDLAVFATSGLETSLFTLLGLAAFVAATGARRPVGWIGASVLFALATSCRPDGSILFAAAAIWAVAIRRPGIRSLAAFAVPFIAVVGALAAWRWAYYGDLLPNTYYAKSADLSWWSQGLHYLALYVRQYWLAVCGAGLGLALAVRSRIRDGAWDRSSSDVVLAAGMSIAYALAVARVGGDFMHARLLIPITPLLLVCTESAVATLARPLSRPGWGQGLAAALGAAALGLTPSPVSGSTPDQGVADERDFYLRVSPELGEGQRTRGEALRPLLEGLPVTVVFSGTEARLVYYARPSVAIEGETGLTDRWVAHQAVESRGRPGHEKHAPPSYMLDARRAQLALSRLPGMYLGINEAIPVVLARFRGYEFQLLRWDPALVETLRRRGAEVPDFPSRLDRFLKDLDSRPIEQVREAYAKLRRFYFGTVVDPVRERRLRDRLGMD